VCRLALVVVRPGLVARCAALLTAERLLVFNVSVANRDALPVQIVGLL
jgi:hypothetical protein